MKSFLLGAPSDGAFNIPFNVEKTPSWVNPYVADGLVAMWDGEWNAGGGVHDSSPAKWVELVRDRPTQQNGLTFGAKCVTFGGNNSWLIDDNSTDVLAALRSDGFTLEYVISPTSHNRSSSNNVYINIGEDSSPRGLMIWDNSTYVLSGFSLLVNNTSYYAISHAAWSGHEKKTNSIIVRKSGNETSLDFFGKKMTATSNYQIATGRLEIGNTFGKSNGMNCDVYCLRIYDRALTAAEIATNYAVDKVRFNLP